MKRAEGVLGVLIALVLACASNSLLAQSEKSPKQIGVVLFGFQPQGDEVQAFRRGLQESGYVEGRDIALDIRVTDADLDRMNAVLSEMIARKVDVLVVESTVVALAAKRATRTIPVVLAYVADPVGSGIVADLSRPGGNITGLSNMTAELGAKRLQLLKEAVPRAKRVGVLWNPDTPWHRGALETMQAAAPGLGVALEAVPVSKPADIGAAFEAFNRATVDALLIVDSPFGAVQGPAIMRLAMKAKLPVVYSHRRLAAQGALLCYAASAKDMFHSAASYVDRILRGAKPGDLPIEQPTKFVLVVNLKTAKSLGLSIPQSVLLQADEVIR